MQMIALADLGWRTATVWECAIKRSGSTDLEQLIESIALWLEGNQPHIEISGESDDSN